MTQMTSRAAHSGVVALRMLASPLEMVCSPTAIAVQGTTPLRTASTVYGMIRRLQPSLKSGRLDTSMNTASAATFGAEAKNAVTGVGAPS